MIEEFFDANGVSFHGRFQAWRTEHQDGVFLTLDSRIRARLHGARCPHLGSGPPYFTLEDGFGTLTAKKKVCASEPELVRWAAANGMTVARCQHCVSLGLVAASLATPPDWRAELRVWAKPIRGVPHADIEEFFRRAFHSTLCPEAAWFGVHARIASLVVGGIFLAALVRSGGDAGLWLLADSDATDLSGISYSPVKSTQSAPTRLIWAHGSSLDSVSAVVRNESIWESFSAASGKIVSAGIAAARDSLQRRRGKTRLADFWEPSPEPKAVLDSGGESDAPEELYGLEGAALRKMTIHRRRERRLRQAKIAEALKRGRLRCEVPGCLFDFEQTYGPLGRGYAQVHHLRALSEREDNAQTTLADLAVVCANCHAMIHLGGKNRGLDQLIPGARPPSNG